MKKMLVGSLLGVLSFASFAFAGEWLTNYDKALEQAKKENKQLLIDFTGSDWCGWCMKLDREVFEKKEFKDYADKKLILLKIDFPRTKTLPPDEKAQNEKLAAEYGIQGFPTLIILHPDGTKAGEAGYTPGGPKAFISALENVTPKK